MKSRSPDQNGGKIYKFAPKFNRAVKTVNKNRPILTKRLPISLPSLKSEFYAQPVIYKFYRRDEFSS